MPRLPLASSETSLLRKLVFRWRGRRPGHPRLGKCWDTRLPKAQRPNQHSGKADAFPTTKDMTGLLAFSAAFTFLSNILTFSLAFSVLERLLPMDGNVAPLCSTHPCAQTSLCLLRVLSSIFPEQHSSLFVFTLLFVCRYYSQLSRVGSAVPLIFCFAINCLFLLA